MPEEHRPFRASYLISGIEAERIFAALLDVRRFPEWASGLSKSRALDASGETTDIRPGVRLEFVLSAAGLTHRVLSAVTVVEPLRRLEWKYVEGAVGSGGWLVEEAGAETVRLTLSTDYRIRPDWLDRIAHRPFFRGLAEDLIRRSMRRFEAHLREGGRR
ncbi:MAG TPA: SRPBCC family protein [Rubrobacter sp.]|nr:SRPBCC family protein [Rubrobacter sp.]